MLANLAIQGYSPYEFVTDLTGTANRYLADRYNGQIKPNIFSQLGVVLNYTANCIAGLIIADKSKLKKTLIFLCSFIPAGLHMVIYADKGTLFLCAAFFYSGVLVARMHAGNFSITNKTTNRVILISLALLFPILIISFLARGIGDGTTEETIEKLKYYFSSYAFGHYYALSDWFSSVYSGYSIMEYDSLQENTYGLYTFMAIFKAMGDTTYFPDGYYDEYYNYHNIIQSNIYTIYRGLINDFTMVGSLIYFIITGFLFNFSYLAMLKARKPVFSVALYMCFAAYTYSSFIISIMTWNSIFAVFVAVCLILGVNSYLSNKRFYFMKP
ncbi:oligosaccharide repeat unit polymerase [Pseudomonas chlororaphis subsp. piscium]|nr:oligosaccharide repeat unit polymerase [Pseudomonas chlororaphis subsp. piscium]